MIGNIRLGPLSFLCDLPEVSRSRWGGVLLGVGERTDSVVFSHALLSAACLCPHPNEFSSFISHRAKYRTGKKEKFAFSHVRVV